MKKGGYQLLDLKSKTLTSGTKTTIAGAFDALDRNNHKRVVVSGMKVSTTEYDDFDANFIPSVNISTGRATGYNGALTIGGNNVTINVANDDGVTVTVTTPNSEKAVSTKSKK